MKLLLLLIFTLSACASKPLEHKTNASTQTDNTVAKDCVCADLMRFAENEKQITSFFEQIKLISIINVG
jgi:hypothetical protein